MSQHNQVDKQIIDKAMRDASFRQRLLNDPKRALKEAFGIDVPAGTNIHVHEESAHDIHLTIPAAQPKGGRELSEAELTSAVGGMYKSDPDGISKCCTCGASTAQTFKSFQKGCGCI
ncbi:NHLP leader peptide family RiPP precursor [Dictyobacter formicarum]|uniref:Nitrile hydratase alpha/Thiocyanate hydrolase gamma domain-containing protein n=1 Tax=Dictyobacter formicarum TaxID=2778368 RepID=A0ABQ3VFL2_9CHLR|nr:NHLP leader peptide family RiPP precursor [Dictyobacter formicarum]GHO84957.1 hypothetical protein KSZ_29630 [Dictyobacter formicarum]